MGQNARDATYAGEPALTRLHTKHSFRFRFVAWVAACLCVLCLIGPAAASVSDLCDDAARRAARETGVPVAVLLAITRTETGRARAGRLEPWPWTVNINGVGHWFGIREAAQDFIDRKLGEGAQSFDIGCFQINHKWHGAAFDSVAQMFDPIAGARYAAAFLTRLHGELGDWSLAAGAYHSRTETHARRYRARFDRILAAVSEGSADIAPVNVAEHRATPLAWRAARPLMSRPGGQGRNGSLVPIGGRREAFIPSAGRF